jgi:hypothetical protein
LLVARVLCLVLRRKLHAGTKSASVTKLAMTGNVVDVNILIVCLHDMISPQTLSLKLHGAGEYHTHLLLFLKPALSD